MIEVSRAGIIVYKVCEVYEVSGVEETYETG